MMPTPQQFAVTRRVALGLAAGLMATGALAQEEPTSPVTITYAAAAYPPEAFQPVIDAFQAAHPNITVEYQSIPFNDFNAVLGARIGGGDDTIDVFDADMPRIDAYALRGWLADVTDAFPDIAEQVDPGSLEAATVDGRLLAMPYQTSTNLMYYNRAHLEAAGLELPSAGQDARMTWEQVAQDARAAQGAGAEWGLVFDQIDRYYQLEPLMVSVGGGTGGTGEGNLSPDVENEGWLKAMTWYGGLFAEGLSPRGVAAAETPDLFAGGQVAYFVGGPWWAPKFVAEEGLDFGVAPFPAFEGGTAASPTGGWALGLNPNSENRDAALIFMRFVGLEAGGYAQHITALAVPPSNLEGAEAFYASPAFADPRMAGVVDLMKYELANTATLRLQNVGYVEFEDVMTRTFSDIINGADPAEALSAATMELDEAWDRYR